MSTKAALAEIEKYVKVFKAFENAQYSLQMLDGIEETIKNQTNIKEQLIKEVFSVKEEITQAKRTLADTLEKTKGVEQDIVRQAEDFTKAILKDAQLKAESIIASARVEESRINERVNELFKQETLLQKDIQRNTDTLKQLEEKLVKVQSSISSLLNIGQ